MVREITKLVIALAILAGAIFIPDYRTFLNPLVGVAVGYYFITGKTTLAILAGKNRK